MQGAGKKKQGQGGGGRVGGGAGKSAGKSGRAVGLGAQMATNYPRAPDPTKRSWARGSKAKLVEARRFGSTDEGDWVRYASQSEAGRNCGGINVGSVSQCTSGKQSEAGGFQFRYVDPSMRPNKEAIQRIAAARGIKKPNKEASKEKLVEARRFGSTDEGDSVQTGGRGFQQCQRNPMCVLFVVRRERGGGWVGCERTRPFGGKQTDAVFLYTWGYLFRICVCVCVCVCVYFY